MRVRKKSIFFGMRLGCVRLIAPTVPLEVAQGWGVLHSLGERATKDFLSQKPEQFKPKKTVLGKKRPVLYTENGPKAKKAYPKTSLDKLI